MYYDSPITDIRLIKCPLSLDERNQLTFNNLNAQLNYFLNLEHLELTDATYQRRDSVIRYGEVIENLDAYNYVMYKNANYRNKWFFAFITSMKWANNNMTDIFIKTDSFQTWQHDLTYKKSFVEREHVNDDTVGKHTIDEGLGTGDYLQVTAPVDINSMSLSDMAVCIAVTQLPTQVAPSIGNNKQHTINGVYSGLTYCIFSHSDGLSKVAEWVDEFINYYDETAKATAINGIFMIPKVFATHTGNMEMILYNEGSRWFYLPTNINTYQELTNNVTVSLSNNLAESYSPVNNKLKCYPYNYLLVSNNAGIDTVFHYEDFTNNTPIFKVIGDITPGCSIKCIPINYLKQADNNTFKSYNYGIVGAKLPICAWTNDVYTNWLTENGLNMAVSTGANLATTAIGLATLTNPATALAGAAMIASGLSGVANTLAEQHKASLAPDQANGNVVSGDINYSAGKSGFTAYRLSIRKEVAQQLDSYFSMYGYKVASLKVPNITGRTNWNFVKTIGANIEAYIPQEDLQNIKNMFDNGVTLWHTTTHFLDYSQSNNIVS